MCHITVSEGGGNSCNVHLFCATLHFEIGELELGGHDFSIAAGEWGDTVVVRFEER